MRIIIIGAGAAGIIAAHHLAKQHQVFLLEKQPLLGGNIRTLNLNVTSPHIPNELRIDNGVIEFHRDHSPTFSKLLAELNINLLPIAGGSTALYLDNGNAYQMPGAIRMQHQGKLARLRKYLRLAWMMRQLVPLGLKMRAAESSANPAMGEVLTQNTMSSWIRMLLMYGYSIPYPSIDAFPAKLAIPTLWRGSIGTRWARIEGGVYSYVERILECAGSNLTVLTNQDVNCITRSDDGVHVNSNNIDIHADKLVIATTPDKVLQLLTNPTARERECFSPWRANTAITVIHTDESIYDPWGQRHYNEFDVFAKMAGRDAGYNAYLNRLCGLPANHPKNYFLAYNLEDRINPDRILDIQTHHTPFYTAEAYQQVSSIQANNGQNHTYFAGAYLSTGLHEGASQSARNVANLIRWSSLQTD